MDRCRAALVLFSSCTAACATRGEVRHDTPRAVEIRGVARDAGSENDAAIPRAVGNVVVSFFGESGTYRDPLLDPIPDARTLVSPCFARELGDTPGLMGWMRFDLVLEGGAARVELLDASPLPQRLVTCARGALEKLHSRSGFIEPSHLTAYVSLR